MANTHTFIATRAGNTVKKRRSALLSLFFALYETVKGLNSIVEEKTKIFQGYEALFCQIVPSLTKFGGARGEGLLTIGEAHTAP